MQVCHRTTYVRATLTKEEWNRITNDRQHAIKEMCFHYDLVGKICHLWYRPTVWPDAKMLFPPLNRFIRRHVRRR